MTKLPKTAQRVLTSLGFAPRENHPGEWIGTIDTRQGKTIYVAFIAEDEYPGYKVIMVAELNEETNTYDESDAMHLSSLLLRME